MTNRRVHPFRRTATLAIAASLLIAAPVSSADIKTKLPQQSIAYVEFAGSEVCQEAFNSTPCGKLASDPQIKKLMSALWAAGEKFLMAEAEREGAGEIAGAVKEIVLTLFKKGMAIDVIGVEMTETGPAVSLVFVSQVGDDGGAFLAQFEKLLSQAPLPPAQDEEVAGKQMKSIPPPAPVIPPIRYGVVDGLFIIAIGADTPASVFAAMSGEAPNLTSNESLSAALKKISRGDNPVSPIAHVNVAQALSQGKAVFQAMTGAEDFPPPVAVVLEESGINAIQSITLSSQVADNGFRTTFYMSSAGEPKGLLKLLAQAPLTDADLLWLPKDATFAAAANFRVSDVYDELMRIVAAVPGAPMEEIEGSIAEIEEEIGLKIRADILGSLDDGWVVFDSPSAGGFILTGFTLAVEVADEDASDKLVRRGVTALLDALKRDAPASIRTVDRGKHKLNVVQFAGVPVPVAPTWAFHDKRLVIGLTPQTVQAALDRVASPDAKKLSILANEDFDRGRKLLPDKLVSVSYSDTKQGLGDLYRLLLLGGIIGTNYATSAGIDIDATMLPTHAAVTEGLFGDVTGATVTESGFMKVSHGPLTLPVPAISGSTGGASTAAVAISVLLPSLSRARHLAKRTVSASNLKGIGMACMIYAYENKEQYPPDLQTLLDRGEITAKMLVDPGSGGVSPSYAYIPGHSSKSDPRWVVAYEDYPGQMDEGANVLFADGHVDFVRPLSRVQEMVARTKAEMAEKAETPPQ